MTYAEKSAALDASNPAVERLGLPSMTGGESTHGVNSGCGKKLNGSTGCPTTFPSGVGLGASFDRQLWREIGHTIGIEARGLNNQARTHKG
jgi:beta-glucosidase-like glycosyl hydrolase